MRKMNFFLIPKSPKVSKKSEAIGPGTFNNNAGYDGIDNDAGYRTHPIGLPKEALHAFHPPPPNLQ